MITVRYELVDPKEIDGADVDVKEDRGLIHIKINQNLTPSQIVSALNKTSEAILAGGHWFQEWKGDIITVDPSEVLGADEPRAIPTQRPTLYNVNGPQTGAA